MSYRGNPSEPLMDHRRFNAGAKMCLQSSADYAESRSNNHVAWWPIRDYSIVLVSTALRLLRSSRRAVRRALPGILSRGIVYSRAGASPRGLGARLPRGVEPALRHSVPDAVVPLPHSRAPSRAAAVRHARRRGILAAGHRAALEDH